MIITISLFTMFEVDFLEGDNEDIQQIKRQEWLYTALDIKPVAMSRILLLCKLQFTHLF